MKYKAKVSILIPAHNQEEFIQQTVESALAQTYGDKEIIISDDASSDQTRKILENYQKYPEVRVYRNAKNLGMVRNHRKLLFELSIGQYAVMLDGDDYFIDPVFLAEAVQLAELYGLRLVFAEAQVLPMDRTRQFRRVSFPLKDREILSYQKIFQNGILFMHGAVLFRRDLALDYDFYKYHIIGEDNVNFLRFIIGENIGFLKRPVYVYRQHRDPRRYPVKERVRNTILADEVYHFAISKQPWQKTFFDGWRQKMAATIFYGHLIHLIVNKEMFLVVRYLNQYRQEYGWRRLVSVFSHPLAALKWGGYLPQIRPCFFSSRSTQ